MFDSERKNNMKDRMHRNAGLISGVLALVLILGIYGIFGTVDLVFMNGENEIHRMDDVSVFSDLTISSDDIETEGELEFTYASGDVDKAFGDNVEFRIEIAKTVLLNFLTFKWQECDQVIVLNAK